MKTKSFTIAMERKEVNARTRHHFLESGTYGDWKDNRQHGHGIAKYRNGAIYDREWKNGKYHSRVK